MASAAVSTRRIRGPRLTAIQPAANAEFTSSSEKPPSGPIAAATAVEDVHFAAMLPQAPRGLPPGWARIRKVFGAKLSIACCQFCGSVISSSRFRPHCLLASITIRLNRSNEAADISATLRFVSSGTIRVTPNSTAFSTSHRWRSPFGSATANVSATVDSRSTASRFNTTNSTCDRPSCSTRAVNCEPDPSNNCTSSPIFARITCNK